MSEQTTEVATKDNSQVAAPIPQRAPLSAMKMSDRGIIINDMDTLWRFANYVADSGLAPKGIDKPQAILVAIQMGLEIGLTPMAALQNIAVINGRPAVYGDCQLAVVRGSGMLEEFSEWFEVGGQKLDRNPVIFDDKTTAAVCRVKRKGDAEPLVSVFSVADAQRAQLWGKAGPWLQYPARMLRFRARGFALRDKFGDVLKGMLDEHEARDLPPKNVSTIQVAPPIFAAPVALPAPVKEADVKAPPQVQEAQEVKPKRGKKTAEAESTKHPEPAKPTEAEQQASRPWLETFMSENNIQWDDLRSHLGNQGFLKDADSFAAPGDVPAEVVVKFAGNEKAKADAIRLYKDAP